MEPQGRGNVPALHTPERNKRLGLEQDHSRIESARSNSWAECRTKYRHRAEGEVFLLTFPLIGLFGIRRLELLYDAFGITRLDREPPAQRAGLAFPFAFDIDRQQIVEAYE